MVCEVISPGCRSPPPYRPCTVARGWPLLPCISSTDSYCKREGGASILPSTPYNSYPPATGCRCIWPHQKHMEEDLERAQNANKAATVTKEVFLCKLSLHIIVFMSIMAYCMVTQTLISCVGLIKKLWEASLTAAQLKSGFRASGLYPLNHQAISADKLAPSVPYAGSDPASATATPVAKVATTTSTTVSLTISVVESTFTPASDVEQISTLHPSVSALGKEVTHRDCRGAITPVQLNVVAYLAQHLQRRNQAKETKDKRKVKPAYYGEALTRDEMIQRMEEVKRKKRERTAKKKGE